MNQLGNQSKKGAILVFVLALIVFISVLCLRLMEETVQELRHVSQQHRRDDLRVNAYSALDLAVGVLNEFRTIEGALYDPAQGWGDPLSWAEVSPLDPMISWTIKIVDESAKINPKNASRKDFVSLFAQMHSRSGSRVDEDDGEPYYDAWMDWEDADDDEREEGAEDLPFNQLGMPASEISLAELLEPAGYHSVHIGKWHLGGGAMSAHEQGFDESLLMASGFYLPEDHPDVVNSKQEFDSIDLFLWRALRWAASFKDSSKNW